jgi:hypothetical protein
MSSVSSDLIYLFILFFDPGSHYAAQADLKLTILRPQPPQCWDSRLVKSQHSCFFWPFKMCYQKILNCRHDSHCILAGQHSCKQSTLHYSIWLSLEVQWDSVILGGSYDKMLCLASVSMRDLALLSPSSLVWVGLGCSGWCGTGAPTSPGGWMHTGPACEWNTEWPQFTVLAAGACCTRRIPALI